MVKCLVTSGYPDGSWSGGQRFESRWRREFLENSEKYLRCDSSSIKGSLCSAKPGCQVAQFVKCLVTSGYPDGSWSGGQRFKSRWRREFLENSEKYRRCDSSSLKGTLCSAKPGCRVAQLVKCLVTSGTAFQCWASAKLCGFEQRAPPILSRVAITLGIGPHF